MPTDPATCAKKGFSQAVTPIVEAQSPELGANINSEQDDNNKCIEIFRGTGLFTDLAIGEMTEVLYNDDYVMSDATTQEIENTAQDPSCNASTMKCVNALQVGQNLYGEFLMHVLNGANASDNGQLDHAMNEGLGLTSPEPDASKSNTPDSGIFSQDCIDQLLSDTPQSGAAAIMQELSEDEEMEKLIQSMLTPPP